MAEELWLAFAGTALVTFGVCNTLPPGIRRTSAGFTLAILSCLCGLALIAVAAVQTGPGAVLRVAITCMYTASGGLLAGVIEAYLSEKRAGSVLAILAPGTTGGFKIILAIVAPLGMLAVIMQMIESTKPESVVPLVGQALLFLTFAARGVMLILSPWRLNERGIIGPMVFVPWRNVTAFDWPNPDTLRVASKIRIPVLPENRERAAQVLSEKAAAS